MRILALRRRCQKLLVACAVAASVLVSPQQSARAATKTFNAAGTNWGTNNDWTPNGVPAATDDVLVNAGTLNMGLTQALTIQYVTYSDASDRQLSDDANNAKAGVLT